MQTALAPIMRDYLIRFQQTAIKETGRRPLTFLRTPLDEKLLLPGCQRPGEDLLESQELDDSRVYVGSKSQTALVRSNSAVELISVTFVNLHLTGIVNPYNSEGNASFRLYQSFQKSSLFVFRMFLHNRCQ